MHVSEIIKTFITNHEDLYLSLRTVEHGYNGIVPNPYHMEGSIWAHTCMVLNEAQNNNATDLMKVAALCHDLGKPFVFIDIEGHPIKKTRDRRRFLTHEAYSVSLTKDVLKSFNFKPFEEERIMEIVALHGSLYGYFDDGRIPEKFHEKISARFSSDLWKDLCEFYYYDHNGRINMDADNSNSKTIHEDFHNIRCIIDRREMGEFHNTRVIDGTITLLVGPPRVGKSTWTEENKGNNVVISRDALVLERGKGLSYSTKWQSLSKADHTQIDEDIKAQYIEALENKSNIIIDMTNMNKKSRKKWLSEDKAKGYAKKCIVFVESLETLVSRNTPNKDIPRYVIENMITSFSWPTREEVSKTSLYFNVNDY